MKKRLFKAKLIGIIIGLLELAGVVFVGLAYYDAMKIKIYQLLRDNETSTE